MFMKLSTSEVNLMTAHFDMARCDAAIAAECEPQMCGFTADDGTRIVYRHWRRPAARTRRGAVILLHRGHEHGGRMAHLADDPAFAPYDIYAWDARGHGLAEGARGAAPDFGTLVGDLDRFVRHLRETDGVSMHEIALVGQSVGAVIAATWVHDHAPGIRAMVLAAPAFDVNLFVPGARVALAAWRRLRGDFTVNSYVRPSMLTSDPARAASYASDPLVTRAISSEVLLDLYRTAERVVDDAAAIHVPVQVLIPGADRVVKPAIQHRFHAALGAAKKECHVFPDLRHDILGEAERAPVLAEMGRFLEECFAQPAVVPSLIDADRRGFTRDETDRLARSVAPFSFKALSVVLSRLNLRVGGALSEGIALGHRTGFDSGATLDYVYRNEARGRGWLGRKVDRAYLDAIGWRGIRQRKRHAEELIARALDQLQAACRPARIIDIAAGHGRYVLDAVAAAETRPESILLRDFCPDNVTAGRALIARRGLTDIARFEQGDAFDGDDLAKADPSPTLAVVSGLYELFQENAPVLASLEGLARAMPDGALLIYTGQPWHPQLEYIARVLTSHRDGRPWVMRRRTQAEMDQLVAAAGFRKIEQKIDRWGIFTVSLAERVRQ